MCMNRTALVAACILVFVGPVRVLSAQSVQFDAAYYPYHQKVRARVNFQDPRLAAEITGASFVLKRVGDKEQIVSVRISPLLPPPRIRGASMDEQAREVVFDTPDLKDGSYEVTMIPEGRGQVPKGPFVARFQRKVWEWEHNDIGKARVIVPPFTPIEVQQNVVSTILRRHTMNGFGLWEKVVAKDKSILASPIKFRAIANNKVLSWKTGPIRFLEKSPDRVVTEASFEGGPIRAKVLSEWDYDGMMKVTLELAATNGKVDGLELLIPLKNDIGRLMHIVGPSIRANPAQAVPAGNGLIWNSYDQWPIWRQHGGKYKRLVGTFVPYVWLGGPERGICWFADTDRDWSLDDEKPAIDIVREGETLTLRVHLFNKPTVLDRPRRIVFGLQATPVKPMPAPVEGKTWRSWTFHGRRPNSVMISILGQCLAWGATDTENETYPRKRDFAIFDEFARARKFGVNSSWVDTSGWLDGYDDQTRRDQYRINVIAGLTAQGADKVVVYTDARGGEDSSSEEALSFNPRPLAGDEWDEPKPSFQDFALFYYKKMMNRGNIDGIYFDNTYAAGNWDTISADAYVRPDGILQPSVGIFNMRNLIKRTAVMYHEAGRRPYTVVHMTNGYIIPALSFATIALDWEHKYGDTDFQDRFSNDFILAESIGRQAGLVPLVIAGQSVLTKDKAEYQRLYRTLFGVTLVHEIKMVWFVNVDTPAYAILFGFGYGLEDCKVYPYWEGNQPVTITGGNTKALVLSRQGKAMVIVTDFGDGGNITMTVDTKALGLRPVFAAKDAETQQKLTVVEGQMRFNLKKHDFRMIVLE